MDKYDKAVAYLTKHPGEIVESWTDVGPLFSFCGDGCLTMIRGYGFDAYTPELTAEISADVRIPMHQEEIKVEHLPVFAEWQRRIDAMGVR